MPIPRFAIWCLALLGLLAATPAVSTALAEEEEKEVFDLGDPPDTSIPLTESLSLGAALDLAFELRRDRDLDSRANDQVLSFEPTAELALSYEPDESLRGFLNLELSKEFLPDSPDGRRSEVISLELVEAYVMARDVLPGTSLQVGRQEFEDEAEWFYGQELDALRVFAEFGDAGLEFSVSQEGLVPVDLLNDDKSDRVVNVFLVGHYAFDEESGASLFMLRREGRDRDSEDLDFLGLQLVGEAFDNLDYRVNGAFVSGDSSNRDDKRPVRGFGFDVLGTYAADLPWEPSITLGYAFGSGDGNGDGRRDNAFRQTGLQSNEAEFNGITSFKYYGEVLDPELSNLSILTAGAGIAPSEGSSLDLVYHAYFQNRASDALADNELEAEPDGSSKSLGHGLDLIIGYNEIDWLSAEFILGAFFPGPAFDARADPAYFAGLEVRFEF